MKWFMITAAQVFIISILFYPVQLTGQDVAIWATDTMLCCGETTQLFASRGGDTTENLTYTWSSDPQTMGWPTNEQNPTIQPEITTVYTVTVSDGSTIEQESITVVVYYPPSVDLGGDISACIYDSVVLTANVPDMQYEWSNGSRERNIKVGSTGIGIDVQQVWLEVTCEAGCIGRDTIMVAFEFSECTYQVSEQEKKSKISVYPNPSHGRIKVQIREAGENLQLTVFNLQGQKIINRYRHLSHWGDVEEQIDLSACPQGIYFLRLVNDREVYQEKILVE